MNSLKSQILKSDQQCSKLIRLCEFSSNDKWSLLYGGTRDGFGSDVFHSKCDGHANTLTLLKATRSSYIFSGFTSLMLDSSSGWKSDPNGFIFSLTNKDNTPLKMKIDSNRHRYAIRCNPKFGDDIQIANNANTTTNNFSNLGRFYKDPQYAWWILEAQSFLAGSFNFKLDEIEVYQKLKNQIKISHKNIIININKQFCNY
jgi:hypothetical protein